jgi:hypothetical protein
MNYDNYDDLVKYIKNYEEAFWFYEYVYLKTIEELELIRADLDKLDTKEHVLPIIKMFLIQWGRMGRIVDIKDLNWDQLTKQLRNAKEAFKKLQGKTFLDINFDDKEIKDAIMKCYEAARIKYIGPTAISKILHLFNPENFVMWDKNIREKYGVKGDAKGYLDFLKRMQIEVKKVLEEKAKEKGCDVEEVIEEICRELLSKKNSVRNIEKP